MEVVTGASIEKPILNLYNSFLDYRSGYMVATNLENMENLENSGNSKNCQNLKEKSGKL